MKRTRINGVSVEGASGRLPATFGLLDMGQLADYVGRHPQVIRKHFADGALPEPRHRIQHFNARNEPTKTTRRFTHQEAEAIKQIFDTMEWGKLASVRNRSKKRKARAAK